MKRPASMLAAGRHLAKADPVMRQLVQRCPPCPLGRRERDPFHVLCTSIISQQLSTRAADAIQLRLMSALGAHPHLEPGHLVGASPEQMRACGLSNAKVKWLRTLGEVVSTGAFSFARLDQLDDEAAIAELDALPGIGRWTAEMFLIFAMNRLDVFAMDDVGLRRSVNQLYGKGRRLSDRRTLAITRVWSPYRSVASWYLWRVADPDTQTWV